MTEPAPTYTARKPRPMTSRQEAMLRYIIRYKTNSGGDSPTYREIMHACGITSQSIVAHNLARLEQRGYISRDLADSGPRHRRIAVTGGRWVYEPETQP